MVKHGIHCPGETPDQRLHLAAQEGDLRCAQAALDEGANANSRAGPLQSTPIMIAALYGHDAIVKLLLLNGADTQLTDSRGIDVGKYLESEGFLRLEVRDRFQAAIANAIINSALCTARDKKDST